MALFPYRDTQSAKVRAEWEKQTQESNGCIPWDAEQPIPRCCCLPRCLSCSLSPLHGLAQLEEAAEALSHGTGRDQLSETPIKAASRCYWRRDAACGNEGS